MKEEDFVDISPGALSALWETIGWIAIFFLIGAIVMIAIKHSLAHRSAAFLVVMMCLLTAVAAVVGLTPLLVAVLVVLWTLLVGTIRQAKKIRMVKIDVIFNDESGRPVRDDVR